MKKLTLLLIWLFVSACNATPITPTVLPTATPTKPPAPTRTPTIPPTPEDTATPWVWIEPTAPPTVTPWAAVPLGSADTLRAFASPRNLCFGAAVNTWVMDQPDYAEVLGREFNCVVAENSMKFGLIHPEPGRYDFALADQLVNFALAHDMKVRGHTLVWYQQMPEWLEKGTWTRDQLIEILRSHIYAVVGRYRGQVYAWDVVNEALTDNGLLAMNQFWARYIGPDYIDLAFQWAHEADPGALLFYNDYGAEGVNRKANGIVKMVADMKARGIPIDGVGLQFHVDGAGRLNLEQVAENMQQLEELGVQVQITELDIRLEEPFNDAKFQSQAEYYADILNVCLGAPNCTAFVLWGFTDKYSWIPDFKPGYGAALIFDALYQPKPAYFSLLETLKAK
jgi:endo-1,4-beta-xylanase